MEIGARILRACYPDKDMHQGSLILLRFTAVAAAVLLSACAQMPIKPSNGGDMNTSYHGSSPHPVATLGTQTMAFYDPDSQPQLGHPVRFRSSAPTIRAASYLLIDAETGKHLASRNADTPRAVASTQKILTALVVLDAGNLDQKVTVQASDVRVEPTVLGLRPGDSYTRRHLLYAFLVKSCNDVANVLARDNAGSISAFASKMNAKARSLGCTNSQFRNPHGLTVSGQYSTARDMARIAMAAYRSPVIRDAVRRPYYTFTRRDGRTVTLKSTNDLLGRMPECNGLKTGYTNASGRCLISSASSRGRHVILVQLGTKTTYIWDDARLLMSWVL